MSSGVDALGSEDTGTRRACDQCRLRKVRCDKDWPCSNCRTARRTCTSTGAGQRPKEHRQRVLISSQYERKIDQIESRLGNIETLLKDLAAQGLQPPHDALNQDPSASSSGTVDPAAADSMQDDDDSDTESVYGGGGGFTAHTTFASEFLESAVQRTSLRDVNPKMDTALTNLRQLVEMQKRTSVSHGPRFPFQRPLPAGGLQKMPMPPLSVVASLLRQSKSKPPTLFGLLCDMVGIPDFVALCRTMYFPTDDFSESVFTLVNAGLYQFFMEQSILATNTATSEEYASYMRLSRTNLETAIAHMPLIMSPKVENVQALIFGGIYALDGSRPSIAWQLLSNAILLCQTGGFHRAEALARDPPEVAQIKKIVFWQAYSLEKSMSLRLGRASSVQDFDISIPREVDFKGFRYMSQTAFPSVWIRQGMLQASTYEHLYSPKAMAGSRDDLERAAKALAAQLEELEMKDAIIRESALQDLQDLNSSDVVNMFVKGDEIQLYSLMTLVYQVISPPSGSPTRFCEKCLAYARKAIQTHKECAHLRGMAKSLQSLYIHWTIMFTPFAPFFVLFCYVIETSSSNDLQDLCDFAQSLSVAQDVSEPAGRLYRLCSVMCDIAVLYVQAKSQQQEDQRMVPVGDEFDMYLSQLGFLPVGEEQQGMGGQPPDGSFFANGIGGSIGDWFSGSRNMMGLLEEDLSHMTGIFK